MATFYILLGGAIGFVLGGWIVEINPRFPAPLKSWLASWFSPKDDKPAEPTP